MISWPNPTFWSVLCKSYVFMRLRQGVRRGVWTHGGCSRAPRCYFGRKFYSVYKDGKGLCNGCWVWDHYQLRWVISDWIRTRQKGGPGESDCTWQHHIIDTGTAKTQPTVLHFTLRCKSVNKHIHMMVEGSTKSYGEGLVKFANSTTLVVTVEPPKARLLAKRRSVFFHKKMLAQDMRLGQLL